MNMCITKGLAFKIQGIGYKDTKHPQTVYQIAGQHRGQ